MICPVLMLLTSSLAEWCGDTSSTLLMNRYSFWGVDRVLFLKIILIDCGNDRVAAGITLGF